MRRFVDFFAIFAGVLVWGVLVFGTPLCGGGESFPGENKADEKLPQGEESSPNKELARGENLAHGVVFRIGRPDASSSEFRGWGDWPKLRAERGEHVWTFHVGHDRAAQWPPQQCSTRDFENAGLTFTYDIQFDFPADREGLLNSPLWLILGIACTHPSEYSQVEIRVNETSLPPERLPRVHPERLGGKFDLTQNTGESAALVFPIPRNLFHATNNTISITLCDGSWVFYDYLMLADSPQIPERLGAPSLWSDFREQGMGSVREVLFARRAPGFDEHWYANFGYYAGDESTYPFPLGSGGALQIYNLDTRRVRTIFSDPKGNLRDPVIHYDATKVLFSYLAAGSKHYNLYEIDLDGSNLRQITFGDWDDIEPCYLPNGDIVFVSSRCKRWVQCWLTPVATLHRCGPDGSDIRPISANIEHDNTPWVLPDGRILYMRWEYVDRSQVDYHHLWTVNPDGTRHSILYGNQSPGTVMIDAKPVPGSEKIVAIFSSGHGRTEHYGRITLVDPKNGPDDPNGAVPIGCDHGHADVWAFSENEFMAARRHQLQLINGEGDEETVFSLSQEEQDAGWWIHEPRPILARPRETLIPEQSVESPRPTLDRAEPTGTLLLLDIYAGRQMKGVPRGTVKELLVLESLPEPIHYNGGMQQISYGGTFTLVRNVGRVPVTPEGSAWMELPAGRPYFFVALDAENRPVKRMHSFTSVIPGETTSCVGCHETRIETPDKEYRTRIFDAMKGGPVRPEPIREIPDVFDFPRDIQPILDRHCLECHNEARTEGGLNLSGDWAAIGTFSYRQLSSRPGMFGDNRNRPMSDFPPYAIGSCQSHLYRLILEEHGGAKLSETEKTLVRHWLEAGANFAGTYAANATGVIVWVHNKMPIIADTSWPETSAMIDAVSRRCDGCHVPTGRTVSHRLSEGGYYGSDTIYNLSRPERSLALLAPLATEAGGLGRCTASDATQGGANPTFSSTEDADYQAILRGIERGRDFILHESNRFTMKPFVPNWPYVREMIRYGVLPADHDPATPLDPYETDRRYWEESTIPAK